jgi:hypothetical protein
VKAARYARRVACCGILEHDPEKWVPVLRKDHAQISFGVRSSFVTSRPADYFSV